ncbi:MAG: glycerol-3-phosphate 1-O-acyltransferase PlsY [Planctomycetota bacterium]|jgi:glycerol-3-phosphate acyltransferase PlsY|nr:glycerol-3-phosphate 1-O-acyltransferase PlsY [Planctomycetota bacterium]
MNITYLSSLFAGYLIGSISFALILARLKGINLREVGSGNLGATNAGRALGKKLGLLVYFLDMLKGAIPVIFAGFIFVDDTNIAVFAGAGAYFGHIWPLYLKFSGGKGVATLSGVLLALAPIPTLIAGIAFFATVKMSGMMSMGSLALGIALPISMFSYPLVDPAVRYFSLFAGLFLFITHRSNILRVLRGEESKIKKKNDQAS